MFLSARERISK
jgi:hypothetical protein